MADSTIANLPAGSPAQASDQLPIQRSSSNYKLLVSDIQAGIATLASPAFAGTPTAPTNVNPSDDSTQIATDAFVQNAMAAFGVPQFSRTVLTNTQVNSLSSAVGIQILHAPPTGFCWFPIAITYELQFGSASFTSGGNTEFSLVYGNLSDNDVFDLSIDNLFIVSSYSSLTSSSGSGQGLFVNQGDFVSDITSQPIYIFNSGSQTSNGQGCNIVITVLAVQLAL